MDALDAPVYGFSTVCSVTGISKPDLRQWLDRHLAGEIGWQEKNGRWKFSLMEVYRLRLSKLLTEVFIPAAMADKIAKEIIKHNSRDPFFYPELGDVSLRIDPLSIYGDVVAELAAMSDEAKDV